MAETGQLKSSKNNVLTANSTYPKMTVQWLNARLNTSPKPLTNKILWDVLGSNQ